MNMRLIRFFLSCFTSASFVKYQSRGISHNLIRDSLGRFFNPSIVLDDFLSEKNNIYYRDELAKMLNLNLASLDYSLDSMDAIDFAMKSEDKRHLIESLHLYLPLLSYFCQSIKKHRKCEVVMERDSYLINAPEDGYPNVRIIKLIVVFDFKKRIKCSVSHILGKEFSRGFQFRLRENFNILLQYGTQKTPLLHKYSKRYCFFRIM